MKHAHTWTSPRGVRQRPRLKGISTEACTPGEEPKVEHSGVGVLDTFLIGAMDDEEGGAERKRLSDLNVRGPRAQLSGC